MEITLFANNLNHHQIGLVDKLCHLINAEYVFIETDLERLYFRYKFELMFSQESSKSFA